LEEIDLEVAAKNEVGSAFFHPLSSPGSVTGVFCITEIFEENAPTQAQGPERNTGSDDIWYEASDVSEREIKDRGGEKGEAIKDVHHAVVFDALRQDEHA